MKILFSTDCLFYLPTRDISLLVQKAGLDGCEPVIDRRFNGSRFIDTAIECSKILPIHSIHAPFYENECLG